MGVPRTYRKSQERIIASFNYNDIASGAGFVSFYPTITKDNSGTQYLLTNDTSIYSTVIETTRITDGTTTLNFDTSPFNLPRTISGTAIANIGVEVSNTNSGEGYSIQIQRWDGSSATNISSEITTINSADAGVGTVASNQIPCTQTLIKKGEQLRIVLKVIVISPGTSTIGHDPRNRDGTILTPTTDNSITSSVIKIPFKIQT